MPNPPVVPLVVPDGAPTVVQVVAGDSTPLVLILVAILGLVAFGLGHAGSTSAPVSPPIAGPIGPTGPPGPIGPIGPASPVKPIPVPEPTPLPVPAPAPVIPTPVVPVPPAPISPGTAAARRAVPALLNVYAHLLNDEREALLRGDTPAQARWPLVEKYGQDMQRVYRAALDPGLAEIANAPAADQPALTNRYMLDAAIELSRIGDLNGPTPGQLAPGHIPPRPRP